MVNVNHKDHLQVVLSVTMLLTTFPDGKGSGFLAVLYDKGLDTTIGCDT